MQLTKITLLITAILILLSCVPRTPDESVERVRTYNINQILAQRIPTLVTNQRRPVSWGHPQTIYIFADDTVWDATIPALRYSLERYFFTTEYESLFRIVRADIRNRSQIYRFNNLIFLADFNSNAPTSQHVLNIMNEQAINSARARGVSMFKNINLWARDQLVMFFIGDSPENISRFLFENADDYFSIFSDRLHARISFQMTRPRGHPDSFFNEMPFIMFIPQTYRVFRKDLENNFICFLWRSRDNPGRNPCMYIGVFWEYADENPVTLEWLLDRRAMIAWVYHDEDEIDPNRVTSGISQWHTKDVLYIFGLWQNAKHFMGGTFQSFAFYDENMRKAFIVDTSVFFPAGSKLRPIMELEVLARTIQPRRLPTINRDY
jgi:hypothetical protein